MTTRELPEHAIRNREYWDEQAKSYAEWAPRQWAQEEITWGALHVPEADIRVLPEPLESLDVIELGCGTAYVSAWLARRGANPVGIDNSPKQLETARRMQDQFDLPFPLHLGNAEETPFDDASFDLAISEYGASIWCDPYKWIPEAARLLRPGGTLIFLINGVLTMLATNDNDEAGTPVHTSFQRPLFGMHRFEWTDDESVEFHLPHGKTIDLLHESGFQLERLIELEPVDNRDLRAPVIPNEWARQWPAEEIWVARKR